MKVIIVGGGPAGLISAIAQSEEKNAEVTLLEKMENIGKKLLITGKGRCNITSSLPIEDFIKNIPENGKFMYSAFSNFDNLDIIELLKHEGVEVKNERGNRIFPVSDKASDVRDALLLKAKKMGVTIKTNQEVIEIIAENKNITGVKVRDNKTKKEEVIHCEKVILATGGKSYPNTGSDGSGYYLASKLGHTITKLRPSLVPLECYNMQIHNNLQGLSLRNIKISFNDILNNKVIYEDFGEMLFTHFGISGPIILSGSAHLASYKNIDELLKARKIILKIDLKPALSNEKLDERILRDFNEQRNKIFKNGLDKLLPQKLIYEIIKISKIPEDKKINEITKAERQELVKAIKNFTLEIKGFRPIQEAIITRGGINLKEVNPKTMESKIVHGLYFAGEILDVDAYTGGFNLQIAYSTGYTAGKN